MTLTSLLVPTYRQMLGALNGWLTKGENAMPEAADDLLSARIAPDMFPLATQVRFACLQVHEAIFRLKDEAFTDYFEDLVNEGRNAANVPGTMSEARARVTEALAMLEGLSPDALDGDENRPIAHEIPNGMIFDLTAEQYARDWALPQFYFHLMSAYAILRGQGIALGKADFIPHMFPFLRAGTMPKG